MYEHSTPPEHESKWRRDLAIALVSGIILIPLGVWITPRLTERDIDRRVANNFLVSYYTDVVQDNKRKETWKQLAPEFQTQPKVGGKQGYEEFWRSMKQVNVADVTPGERKNEFRARLIYKRDDGAESHENTILRLKCVPWYQRLPLLKCEQEHIRILDTFGTTYS